MVQRYAFYSYLVTKLLVTNVNIRVNYYKVTKIRRKGRGSMEAANVLKIAVFLPLSARKRQLYAKILSFLPH